MQRKYLEEIGWKGAEYFELKKIQNSLLKIIKEQEENEQEL
jgi:hypothetical protein